MTYDIFDQNHDIDAHGMIVRHGSDIPPPTMPSPYRDTTLTEITTEIVSAYVAHNAIRPADIPKLISSVHAALAGLGRPVAAVPARPLVPAIPIGKSVTDAYIVCLDDGKRFRSMKRHLRDLGMTPEQYRAKWGLPPDYPIVAPAYAARRSEIARAVGLGRSKMGRAA